MAFQVEESPTEDACKFLVSKYKKASRSLRLELDLVRTEEVPAYVPVTTGRNCDARFDVYIGRDGRLGVDAKTDFGTVAGTTSEILTQHGKNGSVSVIVTRSSFPVMRSRQKLTPSTNWT